MGIKYNTNVLENLTNVEIYGMIKVFNLCFAYTFDYSIDEDFFMSSDFLCSSSSANGEDIEILGYKLSYLLLQKNGVLLSVCLDDEENEHFLRTEENNEFIEIIDYKPTYEGV